MEEALHPVDQRTVTFYGDELTAVRLEELGVYVPVKPICDILGVSWNGQRERINRDPVLADAAISARVTRADIDPTSRQPHSSIMLCLPLRYISGFLFGINAGRVKPELKERLIRYQKECYDVLAQAFSTGRLTYHDQIMQADSPAARAYQIATALQDLARYQWAMEQRLSTTESTLRDQSHRIEDLESAVGDLQNKLGASSRQVTEDQATQLSQAVKAVALALSRRSGRNEYGGVYGELYRRYGITSYKMLPAAKFQEAMNWLTQWHAQLDDDATPF